MEEEQNNQGRKYKVLDIIDDLLLVKQLEKISDAVIMYGELEIEPFVEFSISFQAEYWYLKYCLLKNGKVSLKSSEQMSLYEEKGLNTIWLSVKNDNGIIIECKDGNWFITVSIKNIHSETFLKQFKLSVLS